MFDFFRKHTWLLTVILGLVIAAFVLTSVWQGYSSMTADRNTTVATVDGHKITQTEWDQSHRDQIERVRRQNPTADIRQLETPEMRQISLDAIVRERVLAAAAADFHLQTSDERLQRIFATDPQLAPLRNPDGTVNKNMLAMQGLSSEGFVQRLRQDLSVRQVLQGVSATSLIPPATLTAGLDPLFQQREIQVQRFDASAYLGKVAPTDAQVEAYYKDPAHQSQFRSPEQANVEYVVLDLDAVKKTVVVPEEELRKNYDQNIARYTTPDERRASHILVKADKDAPKAEKDKARAKAEALLADVRKNPAAFADLARKNSDDPGSAANGGDLDFFARGAMVKPFEDTAFGLKRGETSGVVETDFGYHIIRLTDVRGGEKRSFDAVRPELEADVRARLAQQKFSELALEFTNMVYEQSESLKPVVDKFKLPLQTAQNVSRTPTALQGGVLDNPKLREAIFGSDSLTKKRNTEAIETGPSQLVSARVTQYSPARQLPFAEVRDAVRKKVTAEMAVAMAKTEGNARLIEAQKAPAKTFDGAPVTVSRSQTRELPRQVIDAALRADASKLPGVVGADLGSEGYALVRVIKLLPRDPATTDAPQIKQQYASTWTDAELTAYYDSLKKRFKVEIKHPSAAASTSSP